MVIPSLGLTPLMFLTLATLYNIFCDLVLAAKYKLLLKYSGERLSLLNSFFVFTITKFSTTITPFVSGPIIAKPLASRQLGKIPLEKGTFVTVFEQLLDFGMLLLIIPILAILLGEKIFLKNAWSVIALFLLAVLFGGVMLLKRKQFISFIWKFKHFLPKKIRFLGRRAGFSKENAQQSLDEALNYVTNPKIILSVVPFFIFQILAVPIILQLVAAAFDVNLSFKLAFVIYWLSGIAGKLSGSPSGLGVTDISMGGMLAANGVAAAAIIKIVLFYRIVTLIPALAIGAPLALYVGAKYAKEKIGGKNAAENLPAVDKPSQ